MPSRPVFRKGLVDVHMTEKSRKHKTLRTVLSLLPAAAAAALVAVFYALRPDTAFMTAASEGFSRPVRDFAARITQYVPFSLMELCYAAVIIWALVFVIRTVAGFVSRNRAVREKLTYLAKRVLILATVSLVIWAGACWLWFTGYYSPGLADRSGLENRGVAPEELAAVTEFFVDRACIMSTKVERDDEGHFTESYGNYSRMIGLVYDNISEMLPALEGKNYRPKSMLSSKLMSRLGFTGFYFALTGETNINIDSPACLLPSTIAHEAAHQRGVLSEDEANFAAIAACITCDDPVYQYSGYLMGTIHLMNALLTVSPQTWQELYSRFTDEMRTDWADNSEYWTVKKTKVTEISENIYDEYLKANSQELGIQSYGACVDLLVDWLIVKE